MEPYGILQEAGRDSNPTITFRIDGMYITETYSHDAKYKS